MDDPEEEDAWGEGESPADDSAPPVCRKVRRTLREEGLNAAAAEAASTECTGSEEDGTTASTGGAGGGPHEVVPRAWERLTVLFDLVANARQRVATAETTLGNARANGLEDSGSQILADLLGEAERDVATLLAYVHRTVDLFPSLKGIMRDAIKQAAIQESNLFKDVLGNAMATYRFSGDRWAPW